MINKADMKFSFYIIASKTMWHFTKNECTLDAILVVEHCCRGGVLNWLAFVLNALFEACEHMYRWGTRSIFRYLLMSLEMWKWRPPKEREMKPIVEGQPLALCYDPWKASRDPNMKEINEIAFKD